MYEQPKCRSCGRLIRAHLTVQQIQDGKQVLCRSCNREPALLELGIRRVIRRMGSKPEEFEAM